MPEQVILNLVYPKKLSDITLIEISFQATAFLQLLFRLAILLLICDRMTTAQKEFFYWCIRRRIFFCSSTRKELVLHKLADLPHYKNNPAIQTLMTNVPHQRDQLLMIKKKRRGGFSCQISVRGWRMLKTNVGQAFFI